MINNDICGGDSLNAVIVVTSNARNFGLREAQREAFPEDDLEAEGIRRVFILATDPGIDQERVREENLRHGDIVQGNFRESYKHLAYKVRSDTQKYILNNANSCVFQHIMGLNWATTYCSTK